MISMPSTQWPLLMFDPAKPEKIPESNVVEWIRRNGRTRGGAEALVCGETRLSWEAFDVRVDRVTNALIDLGIKRGDRVAILASTSAAYVEIFMGVLRAGACLVPLSTMASSGALEKMVHDSGAKALFLSDSMRGLAQDFAENLDELPPDGRIAVDFVAEGWSDYEGLLAMASHDPAVVEIDLADPFNIIYSSGTTGTPKGILHDHLMRAIQMERIELSGYGPDGRTLLSTPLYSNTTIVALLPTLVAGGCVALMPKFDAWEYLALVERERITHAMLVPVQYKRIMDVPNFTSFDLSTMEMKFSTSAPLRADVKTDVLARFPGGLTEYYGLTEGGGTTILRAHDHPDKLHTVGEPAPGVELKFIDHEGREVPVGTPGEICGRSATMMRGYFGREDLTGDYLWHDADGRAFFRSGDMGVFDEDGFLVLTDRKKDMIISGGLNIFANDLELALLEDEDVEDAAVIGVPSERWGETPLGLVVMRKGAARNTDDVLQAANERLGKSQRLSAVETRNELPRSTIGKILKRELRAPYWAETTA